MSEGHRRQRAVPTTISVDAARNPRSARLRAQRQSGGSFIPTSLRPFLLELSSSSASAPRKKSSRASPDSAAEGLQQLQDRHLNAASGVSAGASHPVPLGAALRALLGRLHAGCSGSPGTVVWAKVCLCLFLLEVLACTSDSHCMWGLWSPVAAAVRGASLHPEGAGLFITWQNYSEEPV